MTRLLSPSLCLTRISTLCIWDSRGLRTGCTRPVLWLTPPALMYALMISPLDLVVARQITPRTEAHPRQNWFIVCVFALARGFTNSQRHPRVKMLTSYSIFLRVTHPLKSEFLAPSGYFKNILGLFLCGDYKFLVTLLRYSSGNLTIFPTRNCYFAPYQSAAGSTICD